jgi:hypothetical protein
MKDVSTMAQYLIWAMEGRGKMSLCDIYREVEKSCKKHGRELPNNSDAEIRRTLRLAALQVLNTMAATISLSGMSAAVGHARSLDDLA